jgi:hypothetical protein
VDPPAIYYDEIACIAVENVGSAGSCIIDGECCVIIEHHYCGI